MGRPMILGHRGWSHHYPENTLIAFEKALKKVDGIEFDVQLSADQTVVVMHDATIERTTLQQGLISELTYEKLSTYNTAATWGNMPFQRIPTLQEVLDAAYHWNPNGLINVEVKSYSKEWQDLVYQVLEITNQHPLNQSIIYSSFHHDAVALMKEMAPDIKVGLLFEGSLERADYQRIVDMNAYSVHINHEFLTSELVEACHGHGLKVAVWTVDSIADLRRCIDENVDMIISNHLDHALQALGQ